MVKRSACGFTVIELLVVMGIFLSLITLTWVNITTLPSRITLTTTYQNILGDLKNQQSEAMDGASDFGIFFGSTSYTLFKGTNYNANDPTNFIIQVENANLNLTTNFSGNVVVFKSGSGEINNFLINNNSITITDNLSGEVKILNLNKYGVSI